MQCSPARGAFASRLNAIPESGAVSVVHAAACGASQCGSSNGSVPISCQVPSQGQFGSVLGSQPVASSAYLETERLPEHDL